MITEATAPERPIKFLLVDDLEGNLLALSGLLQRDGLELLQARSGLEALELLLVHDIALAFLDVQMPGMDGFELAELMRGTERTRLVPIIFVTAGAMDMQRRFRGYEVGAVDFIFKPIEPHILKSKADVFFELARQRAELDAARYKLSHYAADLERTVRERTLRLQEVVQELEAFSYSMAHDLRAPVRSMRNFANLLLEEHAGQLDALGNSHLQRIARAAARMDALIRDVLNYSHVLRADTPLAPVDLRQLLLDVVANTPEWQPPNADIQISDTIPVVLAHEGLLTQCILNLLGNAVKFVAPGVKPQVSVWAETRASQSGSNAAGESTVVRVWIEDNGIGIAPKDRERIFLMFERINPESQFEGTGIGLTIIKKSVERMRGRIGFESTLGKGTKFWIELTKSEKLPPQTSEREEQGTTSVLMKDG